MTRAHKQLYKDLMYVNCAWLLLNRGYDIRKYHEEDTRNIDLCVEKAFAGDWKEFKKWAIDYMTPDCGCMQ
jgi:hypothetical protein